MKVAVTGATGFVGRPLCDLLQARGYAVRALVRNAVSVGKPFQSEVEIISVGDIGAATDWSIPLIGVDCVIHCAGRTHVMHDSANDALAAYREVNVLGTRRLAEQAAAAGVKRLVFLSSIKVNGEQTLPGKPYVASDAPRPEDPYGQSKCEAEAVLHEVSASAGLEVVIVRPPLIYGPGVKGNLAKLLRLVKRGLPLPVALVKNSRSLVGIDNLLDLLVVCLRDPRAAGQIFLVSDGDDLSTPDLLRRMATAIRDPAHLWPVPVSILRLAGQLTGRSNEINRLVGSLQVDISQTRERLSWSPPFSVEECLRRMVASDVNARV